MDLFRIAKNKLTRRGFERELGEFLPELYRVARGLTGDRDSAEDLAHDVCVKAIAAFSQADLRDASACHAWLYQIMLNRFRDQFRRDKRSPIDANLDLDNVIEFVPGRRGEPSTEYQRELFRKKLDESLRSLSPEIRFATVLHLVRGVAYKDIALIVDCPIGTVMSRIAKGRQALRAKLSAAGVDDLGGSSVYEMGGDR